jgi:hypothetical protein
MQIPLRYIRTGYLQRSISLMDEYLELLKDIGISILFLPLGALVTAIVLRWLNLKIAKFVLSFSRAYRIEIIVGVAHIGCYLAAILIGLIIDDKRILNVLIMILIFLVGAPFYSRMIKHPEYGPIGWIKGSAYSIIFGGLDIALQLLVTLIPLLILSVIY